APAGVSQTPPNALLNVIITAAPANGTLTRNGTPVLVFPATIPANDFATGNVTFTPSADKNSPATTLFNLTFKVQDDGGTARGPDTIGPDIDTDATVRTLTFTVAAEK